MNIDDRRPTIINLRAYSQILENFKRP